MQAIEKNIDTSVAANLPHLITPLPGPKAKAVVDQDHAILSPSYTRDYPLVAKKGYGAMVEDVDGNRFLDFAAGIAVVSTGHCHPNVVHAIQKQAAELIHMSGTDFYYPNLVELAEKLAAIAPGKSCQRRNERCDTRPLTSIIGVARSTHATMRLGHKSDSTNSARSGRQ